MMTRYFSIFLFISFLWAPSRAQDSERTEYESPLFDHLFFDQAGQGEIKLIQEPKLDEVMILYMEENRKLGGIPCYWIRIYSGSSHNAREEAYQAKAKFLRKYDGIRNDVIYDDPNFKVYIGGYRSKSEALKLLNRMKKDFPTAFIVYDIIDFPER